MAYANRIFGALAGLLLALPVWAQTSPQQTTQDFLTMRLQDASTGAPSGAELLHLSPYLSPDLVCLLGAAQRYRDQHAQALPDQKPPFAEGDLYSSHFEIPNRFSLGTPKQQGETASVEVAFEYADTNGVTQSWRDEYKLRHINKRRWQIEDIAYQGDFPFGSHGSLRANLLATLSNPAAGSGWDPRELSACELPAKKAPVKKPAPKKTPPKKPASTKKPAS